MLQKEVTVNITEIILKKLDEPEDLELKKFRNQITKID